jgi:hypothetical protein
MEINDFVFVTFTKDFDEVYSTHVVLKEKLDDFVNDKYAMFGIGVAHINKAVMCFNGSIGKGDYIKSINIYH